MYYNIIHLTKSIWLPVGREPQPLVCERETLLTQPLHTHIQADSYMEEWVSGDRKCHSDLYYADNSACSLSAG